MKKKIRERSENCVEIKKLIEGREKYYLDNNFAS